MSDMKLSRDSFVEKITQDERLCLEDMMVEERLARIVCVPDGRGLRKFAEAFYFVRYDFSRINFIVGARGAHENYWRGLVRNLLEELGGLAGPSHNELYRWFLREPAIGLEEGVLISPAFASRFNKSWSTYANDADYLSAIAAIAVYEILDCPDYTLLLSVLRKTNVTARGLRFFEVHAAAEHFELFDEGVAALWGRSDGPRIFLDASRFVLGTQRDMWRGLLEFLEEAD